MWKKLSQYNIEILYILTFQILSRFSAKFLVLSRFSHFLGQISGHFCTWTDTIQISMFSRFRWEPCILATVDIIIYGNIIYGA